MKKLHFIFIIALLTSSLSFGQMIFEDNFDAYTAGTQLTAQTSNWTTWSGNPSTGEDPYVSNAYAYSGTNSVNIITNNDLVYEIPNYTTGKYSIKYMMYIPTGNTAYWNILTQFNPSAAWGVEVYFNAGGAGSLLSGAATFTYSYDTWFSCETIIDLDADVAEFYVAGSLVHSWTWSNAGQNQLGGNDFFGAAATDSWYLDDYQFSEVVEIPPLFFDDFDSYLAGTQLAAQTSFWTTWSASPGSTEDPVVSTDQAYSGANSVLIQGVNDCVHEIANYTSGKYKISFYLYIPTGYLGYFNTLQDFAGTSSQWGMQVYFDAGGAGSIDGGASAAATFTFPYDTWMPVEVVVDLDADWGEFYYGGSLVHGWIWSSGTFGTGTLNQLGGSNFYAWDNSGAGTPKFYIDDYALTDLLWVPVELTSFTASAHEYGKVMLNWVTATETNNLGFEIERRVEGSNTWINRGFEQGAGTSTQTHSYSFSDDVSDLSAGSVFYRLKQIDFDGRFEYSDEVMVISVPPTRFNLAQNYPNPFNPTTVIQYAIPVESHVTIKVLNAIGEEVAELLNETKAPGTYEINFNAKSLSSGVYFYRIQAGNFVETKRMMLIK